MPMDQNRQTRWLRMGLMVAVALAGLLAGGCAAIPDERNKTFGFEFESAGPLKEPSAVVFFVDGVNSDVFAQMLAAGRLPNLDKYFVSRGLYVERCLSNIPSVTLANETSMVTGLFPGHHGITGINWFDRNRLIWRDYETIAQKNTLDGDYRATTIYEYLHDGTTFSLFFQAHRGASKFVENWLSAGPPFFFGWYHFVDRLTLCRFAIVAEVARMQKRFAKLTIAYLLAPDMVAYRDGIEAESYRRALEHADAHIGRVIRDFESAGMLERLVLVVTVDHGMMQIRKHFPIEPFVRKTLGLAVARCHLWEQTRFQDRLRYYNRFSTVLAGSGDRYWALYLRRPARDGEPGVMVAGTKFASWVDRPTVDDLHAYPNRAGERIDLIGRLVREPAVDAVAFATGPNSVRLVRKEGIVEFRRPDRRSRRVSYHVLEGADPLGYEKTVPPEMLDGSPHDSRAWLEHTSRTEFPDLPVQLLAYFDAPRAGDVAVFAAPGWDFTNRYRAGHGGLRPAEMHYPLLLAGPGVPHGRLRTARCVDLVPTLLALLGKEPPDDLDGVSLVPVRVARSAGQALSRGTRTRRLALTQADMIEAVVP